MKFIYEIVAGLVLAAIVAWSMAASITNIPFIYQGF